MSERRALTSKGAATRARIVEAASDLVLARGVGATSLDDIRAGTATSKSQLFHYFPGGKAELVSAIVVLQRERVFDAQRPFLDELDTWASWKGWRRALITHFGSQPQWGGPMCALFSELIGSEPLLAEEVKAHTTRWRMYLRAGLTRMRASGLLRASAKPEKLSFAVFAALQGGLLLTQLEESSVPLEAALDGAIGALRAHAA